MTPPAVTKHLKVLERAGQFWEESLDRLEVYLRELQAKEQKHGR